MARYDPMTSGVLVEKLQAKQFYDEFMAFRQTAIDMYIEAGTTDTRISWRGVECQVVTSQAVRLKLIAPRDKVWEPQEYIEEFGHWTTNGKGHKFGTWFGTSGVLVPARRIYELERSVEESAEKRTVHDSSDNAANHIGDDQLQVKYNNFANALQLPKATGMSSDSMLEALLKSNRSSSSGSNGPASAAQAAPRPTDVCTDDGDDRLARRHMTSLNASLTFGSFAASEPHASLDCDVAPGGDGKGEKAAPKRRPKAKAIPAPQAAAPADAGGVASRGRKSDALADVLAKADRLINLAQSEDGEPGCFFKKSVTANRRMADTLFGKLNAWKFTDGEEQKLIPAQKAALKQLRSLADVAKVWVKSETFDDAVGVEFRRCIEFLAVGTHVPSPFPFWLPVANIQQCVVVTNDVNDFKKLLSKQYMLSTGIPEARIPPLQVDIVAQKLVSVAKDENMDTVPCIVAVMGYALDVEMVDSTAHTQMQHVLVLVAAADNMSKVPVALQAASDPTQPIVAALKAWPTTRALVESAGLLHSDITAAEKALKSATPELAKLVMQVLDY